MIWLLFILLVLVFMAGYLIGRAMGYEGGYDDGNFAGRNKMLSTSEWDELTRKHFGL